jgi:hypothetical protein
MYGYRCGIYAQAAPLYSADCARIIAVAPIIRAARNEVVNLGGEHVRCVY